MPSMLGGYSPHAWEDNYKSSIYDTAFGMDTSSPDNSGLNSKMDTAKQMSKLGLFTASLGAISSAIGGFYAAKTAQYEAKSAASNYQFQSDMDALNARSSEIDAQSILEASKSDIQQYTMQAGQQKASVAAATAHRGVVAGVGSARDVSASMDVVKDIDVMTINSNAVRAAWAKRTQATNYRNNSLLENTSAVNARRFADSISPGGIMTASLLGSASRLSTVWLDGKDPNLGTRYPRY
jgi:hypothetical protein